MLSVFPQARTWRAMQSACLKRAMSSRRRRGASPTKSHLHQRRRVRLGGAFRMTSFRLLAQQDGRTRVQGQRPASSSGPCIAFLPSCWAHDSNAIGRGEGRQCAGDPDSVRRNCILPGAHRMACDHIRRFGRVSRRHCRWHALPMSLEPLARQRVCGFGRVGNRNCRTDEYFRSARSHSRRR